MLSKIDFTARAEDKKIPPDYSQSDLTVLVPMTGVEPVRIISPRDFKSLVSAYSTTSANITVILYYLSRDLSSRFQKTNIKFC